MLRFIFMFCLLYSAAFAAYELKSTYMFTSHNITSTSLFPSLKDEFTLFTLEQHKTQTRVKSSDIIAAFAEHGITVGSGKNRYINFIKKSPIDTTPLENIISKKYLHRYPSLKIKSITVIPRVYTAKLPEKYAIVLSPKSLRNHEGTFYVQSQQNRKLFFDYTLDARIGVIHAKLPLERKEELSALNTVTIELPFSRVGAFPLTSLDEVHYRLKHRVKADTPISRRDVESAPMVKRGKNIAVEIKSGGLLIQFSAIALQDGGLHDIISIQKSDGQRMRAKVTGMNRVEIQ